MISIFEVSALIGKIRKRKGVLLQQHSLNQDYQRMSLGSVTLTNGPDTVSSWPNWQLHTWQRGTMYHLLFDELTNCTWAPSVALL